MRSLSALAACLLVRLVTFPVRLKCGSLSSKITSSSKKYTPPKDMDFSELFLGGVRAEMLSPHGFNGYILHFHGGGRTAPLNNFYRKVACRLAHMTGCAVVSVNYPTGLYTYPIMHDYCYAASVAFAERFPMDKTVFFGDSYGANLALSCMLRARDNGVPLPAACVCVSPFADMSASGDSYLANCRRDPIYGLTAFQSKRQAPRLRRISAYCGDADLKGSYLSPCFGDYSYFPPLLVQTGGAETSASDAVFIASAAAKAGVPCRLHIFDGMWHDFQYIFPRLKESRAAYAEISEFIASALYLCGQNGYNHK